MIFNLYKPVRWTSFDVVKKIRGITHEKKVGHGGTLDPFAEGVLIIGTGKDTKVLSDITDKRKSYLATLTLGKTTNTLDVEGKVTEQKPIPNLTSDTVRIILSGFTGKQKQIPPMFSAKKVKGVRLYILARKNKTIEREPRQINIYNIDFVSLDNDTLIFSVTCSKGTYVRVLGKDIAEALGTVGYLTKLVRTNVGDYTVSDSVTIEQFEKRWIPTEV